MMSRMRSFRAGNVLAHLLLLPQQIWARDATQEEGASGQRVVETCLYLLAQADIFPSDNGFLRRVAWVESRDGTLESTYREGYHGGIFQVDRIGFEATQDVASHPDLRRKHELIQEHFGLDWPSLGWTALRKPLYSMLAARLFLANKPQAIPSTLQGQAEYWKQHYNSNHENAAGSAEKFLRDVEALEAAGGDCGSHVRLVAMMVLDASGSIGRDGYEQAKSFLADSLLPSLEVGPDRSRVALLYYDNTPVLQLNFTEDAKKAQREIEAAAYPGGGTRTGRAMEEASQLLQALDTEDLGLGMLMLVLTDGRSADEVEAAAQRAKKAGITVLALGIGQGVDHDTLLSITANVPEHVLTAGSYASIGDIRKQLLESACRVPTQLEPKSQLDGAARPALQRTLGKDQMTFVTVPVKEEGVTIDLRTSTGSVTGYASYKIATPSSAFHDWELLPGRRTALPPPPSNGRRLAAQNSSQNTSDLYIGFEGHADNNTFEVEVSAGMLNTPSVASSTQSWTPSLGFTCLWTSLLAVTFAATMPEVA